MSFDVTQKSLPKVAPIQLARYILANIGPTSHLKLQKLVFYIEAFHLAVFEDTLIDEDFEAWVHGPVCKSLYIELKKLDAQLYSSIGLKGDIDPKEIKTRFKEMVTDEQVSLIGDVLKQYGKLDAYRLESLTHSEKPWMEARVGLSSSKASTKKIKKATMMEFYKSMIRA